MDENIENIESIETDQVPEEKTDKNEDQMGTWIAIGLCLGVAVSSATGNWVWLSIGLVMGVAIGTASNEQNKKKKDDGE